MVIVDLEICLSTKSKYMEEISEKLSEVNSQFYCINSSRICKRQLILCFSLQKVYVNASSKFSLSPPQINNYLILNFEEAYRLKNFNLEKKNLLKVSLTLLWYVHNFHKEMTARYEHMSSVSLMPLSKSFKLLGMRHIWSCLQKTHYPTFHLPMKDQDNDYFKPTILRSWISPLLPWLCTYIYVCIYRLTHIGGRVGTREKNGIQTFQPWA